MSNHFTGLSLGPPLGDQRLDLCDLYAFQSPSDKNRTVIILNANPNADALHPDAIYRVNIDTDGDYLTDIAFSYVFSKPQNGRQTFSVFMAKGAESRSAEAVGTKIVSDAEVSFGTKPNIVTSGPYTFFAGSRSDAFFFDFDGIKNLFDTSGKRNFTEPHLGGKSPWTGVDSNTQANVFSTAVELPTSELDRQARDSCLGAMQPAGDGKLLHVDRAGHPSVSSFFNTDDTKLEYNASEPVNDRSAVARAIHPSDGAYRQLHPRGSDRCDRQGAHASRRAEFRSVEAGAISERPGVHRRRDQLPPRVPDERRVPALRASNLTRTS